MSIPVRVDPKIRAHVVRSGIRLELGHPLAGKPCAVCDGLLMQGTVSLVYVGRDPGDRGWTAASVAVHDACTDIEVTP